jgi:hypothetical protein
MAFTRSGVRSPSAPRKPAEGGLSNSEVRGLISEFRYRWAETSFAARHLRSQETHAFLFSSFFPWSHESPPSRVEPGGGGFEFRNQISDIRRQISPSEFKRISLYIHEVRGSPPKGDAWRMRLRRRSPSAPRKPAFGGLSNSEVRGLISEFRYPCAETHWLSSAFTRS